MPEMAARPLHLCLPLQKIPREARLLQEAHKFKDSVLKPTLSERVRVAEAAAKNQSIFDMADPVAISEFQAVCGELTNRLGI